MFRLKKVLIFLLFMLLVWGSAAAGKIFDTVKYLVSKGAQ